MKTKIWHKIIIGDSRYMDEVKDKSVHLVITSPPYWQLKDYGVKGQIGFDDSYQNYIANLNKVWLECHRILHLGCRLCINIGDQFARAIFYGRYKVIPIRTEIIKYCETIGFDYMGAIIWQKVTTCQTTGGATVMGSYPYPRGGIIKIDYEFILIFKKLGRPPQVSKEVKEKSKLTNEEWNKYFNGHWDFPGEKQNGHIAMFPLELPRRLIKMFSFYGDTVLDPFLGSGTTSRAALELGRNSIGYEINEKFLEVIKSKMGISKEPVLFKENFDYEIIFQRKRTTEKEPMKKPMAEVGGNQLERLVDPKKFKFGTVIDTEGRKKRENYYFVKAILDTETVVLESGLKVKLLGVKARSGLEDKACEYLKNLTKGQKVFMKFDDIKYDEKGNLYCYLYLKNKTFINAHLIRNKLVDVDKSFEYKYQSKFIDYSKMR
ncbi:site-specific DNA-methyltransferase [Patescibacteria group bacterium]|nr:site-specific DNA-methyltransferase [Patescibacteria group bacterium]